VSEEQTSARLKYALRYAFPPELPTDRYHRGSGDTATAVGLFAVSAAVLALRAPVAFSKIWAEDGREFLGGASRGVSNSSVFAEYRGYLAVFPRLVAQVVAQLPPSSWAIALAIAAIATTAATASLTFLVARWYIPQRAICALLGLSVALVPTIRTETINNVANQQFVLAFAAFWLFLAPPRKTARTILSSAALLIIGLSSPLAFVLIPLPIARVLRYGRQELPLLVATVGALLVQGAAHVFWSSSARGQGITAVGNAAVDYGRDVIEPTFGGFHSGEARALGASMGVAVALGATALAIWWLSKANVPPDEDPAEDSLTRLEFLMAASLLLSVLFMGIAVQLGGTAYRYAVPPSLFLTTFLAAGASRAWIAMFPLAGVSGHGGARRRLTELAIAGLSILVVVGWVRGFAASDYRQSGATWSASLASARSTCRGRNHPERVRLPTSPGNVEGSPWFIELDCESL
jgi:hypothetical protein